MCRLAAFPPGFDPDLAVDILYNFAKGNTDGTGEVYLNAKGEFVVNKIPDSLPRAFKKIDLLGHMPHDGWTVVHLRAATHGKPKLANTHPFVKGDWAVAHNGVWSEHKVARAAMKPYVNLEGQTDSEVAAQVLANVGPGAFYQAVDFGGVFLALNKSGELWAIKTSGDLEIAEYGDDVVVASEFERNWGSEYQNCGVIHFSKTGKILEKNTSSFGFGRGTTDESCRPRGDDHKTVEEIQSMTDEEFGRWVLAQELREDFDDRETRSRAWV